MKLLHRVKGNLHLAEISALAREAQAEHFRAKSPTRICAQHPVGMRRLLPAEAAGPLLTQLLFTRKNADDVRAACALEERLLAQVPVWLLQNRGDAASAALCRDTLMEAQT